MEDRAYIYKDIEERYGQTVRYRFEEMVTTLDWDTREEVYRVLIDLGVKPHDGIFVILHLMGKLTDLVKVFNTGKEEIRELMTTKTQGISEKTVRELSSLMEEIQVASKEMRMQLDDMESEHNRKIKNQYDLVMRFFEEKLDTSLDNIELVIKKNMNSGFTQALKEHVRALNAQGELYIKAIKQEEEKVKNFERRIDRILVKLEAADKLNNSKILNNPIVSMSLGAALVMLGMLIGKLVF